MEKILHIIHTHRKSVLRRNVLFQKGRWKMALISGKQLCAHSGCRKWARNDGSGLCLMHDPEGHAYRREWGRLQAKRQLEDFPERRCAHEGCKKLRKREGTGFCNFHDPDLEKKRQSRIKRANTLRDKVRLPERMCVVAGCKNWRMRNGSEMCPNHDPVIIEKRKGTRHKNGRPAEKTCSVKGCRGWAVQDGTGLCIHHHSEISERKRKAMMGNKHTLGKHLPWLGLANIEEARGLLFYSLETDQPLLTLRALTKIASLHHLGQMTMPKPLEPGNEESRESEGRQDLKTLYSNLFTTYPKRC